MTGVTAIFPPVSFLRNKSLLFPASVSLAALLFTLQVFAVDRLAIQLGSISGADWSAAAVTLEIHWQEGEKASYSLAGEQLKHPALTTPLEHFGLECSDGRISDWEIACDHGALHLNHAAIETQEIPLRFRWNRRVQTLEIESDSIGLRAGSLSLQVNSDPGSWSVRLHSDALDLKQLERLFRPWVPRLAGVEISGSARITLEIEGKGEEIDGVRLDTRFKNVAFSDAAYEYLGEELSGEWSLHTGVTAAGWRGSQKILLRRGALLTPFLYLAPEKAPVTLTFGFAADNKLQRVRIDKLEYHHPGILELAASATLVLDDAVTLQDLQLVTGKTDLQAVNEAYIQPIAAETLLDGMEVAGTVAVELTTRTGGPLKGKVDIRDLYLEQGDKLFAVYGLNGTLVSTSDPEGESSRLSWEGGHLMQTVVLGAAEAVLRWQGETLKLAKPMHLPVLDGAIKVERFAIGGDEAGPQVAFEGVITPISMAEVSRALGWPQLAGTLSGVIPGVAYEKGGITIDGAVLVRVFDGDIVIRDLRLEELFGVLPRVRANLELKALDLETLTRTFSFGKITGKLDGEIKDLYLEEWQPISFDARFATPEGDGSRHRISQRAVDNISNLGGAGVSGAVSRTFMRMFEEFGYSRLGISCRLQRGVCEMGGIGPAKRGYYLVKGGGIPRIDIVGFNRYIDWKLLIAKLEDISRQEAPVVKQEE